MKEPKNIYYLEKHQACVDYLKEIDTGFIYEEHKEGDRWKFETTRNYLVVVLEGRIRLTCNAYKNREFGGKEIFLLPKGAAIYSECLADARVMTAAFYIPTGTCEKLNYLSLSKMAASISDYRLDSLPVRHALELFCTLEIEYLSLKANCRHLHEAKLNELFYCLRFCYSREELARLFYPLLTAAPDFHLFILGNYRNVKSVKELIALSHMGKTVFYKKFSDTFGMPAKQWLLERKLERMSLKTAEPGMNVKQMMAEFDFDSLSAFQTFCKVNFGCTPSRFIENARTDTSRFCGAME